MIKLSQILAGLDEEAANKIKKVVEAITFEAYKKLHPKTKKKASDPMFRKTKKKKVKKSKTAVKKYI